MERQTFERALHMWDKWHESIETSRTQLGFDVKSPAEDRIKWINDHVPEVREQAERELKKLEGLELQEIMERGFRGTIASRWRTDP